MKPNHCHLKSLDNPSSQDWQSANRHSSNYVPEESVFVFSNQCGGQGQQPHSGRWAIELLRTHALGLSLLVMLTFLFCPSLSRAANTISTCANLVPLAFVATPGQTNTKTFYFWPAAPGTNRQYTYTWSATGLPSGASLSSTGLLTMLVRSSDIGTTFSGINISFNDGVTNQTASGLTITIRTNQTYWVATTGSDFNPGTQASPFLTIGKASAVSLPGDTININDGYYPEVVIVKGGRGSDGSNGPEQTAGTNGSDITKFVAVNRTNAHCKGFVIYRDGTEINGLSLTNWLDNSIELHANNDRVVNNYFHDPAPAPSQDANGGHHIAIWANWYQWPNNEYVASNHFYKCQSGVYGRWWNSLCTENDVERLYQWNTYYDADYINFFGEGNVYSYNWLHGSLPNETGSAHVDCFQTYDDPSGYYAANCEFHHNFMFDADEGIEIEGQWLLRTTNLVFHHNLIANKLHTNGPANVHDAAWTIMTNNTFYNWSYGTHWSTNVYSKATNGVFRDNIIVFADQPYQWDSGLNLNADYNWGYQVGTNGYPTGPHDVYGIDPLFVNTSNPFGADGIMFTADDGFQLQPTSRALTNSDVGGQIGAYEGSEYIANAIHFGGPKLTRTSALANVSDGKVFTFSAWFNLQSINGNTLLGISKTGQSGSRCLQILIDTQDHPRILAGDGAGNTYIDAQGSGTFNQTLGGWHHFFFTCDLTDITKRFLYMDGVLDNFVTWNVYANNPIKFTGDKPDVGYDEFGGSLLVGCLAELWFGPGQYSTNVAGFISGGEPINLGSTGATPTGTAPALYLNQAYSTFQTDQSGNANNFTVTGGSLTDCAPDP